MTVSYNTIQAEGLGSFFKKMPNNSAKAGKKQATNAVKKPATFVEIDANVATAAASRNPKATFSTLSEVKLLPHGKGLIFTTICKNYGL